MHYYFRWQTVMDCRGNDGYTPMKQLIIKMPIVAEVISYSKIDDYLCS